LAGNEPTTTERAHTHTHTHTRTHPSPDGQKEREIVGGSSLHTNERDKRARGWVVLSDIGGWGRGPHSPVSSVHWKKCKCK